MVARETALTEHTGAARVDREVLSSHPEADGARWRHRTAVTVMALTMMLPVGSVLPGMRVSHSSAAVGADHRAASPAGPVPPSAAPSRASLVALVQRRCPHLRRLELGGLETSLFVRVGPCRRAGGGQGQTTLLLARVPSGWVEVSFPPSKLP